MNEQDDAPSPAPSPPSTASTASTPSTVPPTVVRTDADRLSPVIEQFAHEYLKDRRSERRWRRFTRLMWIALALAFLIMLVFSRGRASAPVGPHTALIEIRGEIAEDTEASAEKVLPGLKLAFEDLGAQAVVLRINSPGGSPVQSGIIHDEIVRLKALHKKKVYAVVEEAAASGAYYVAVAADEIYADKASIVGSIGVLMNGFGFGGLMDKLGVERRLLTAGENKAIGDPFSPLSAKHRAHAQAMLDQIHQQFIAVVRQGRGARLKETPETFSGLFWNGEKALELGLIDQFGNLEFVAREVVKAEEIVDYSQKDNVAERIAKRFGVGVGAGAVKALQGLGSIR
jgi:protease IV